MSAPIGFVPPALSAWQLHANGLTIGLGTSYDVLMFDGLGPAKVSSGNDPRPRDTGQFVGLDVMNQGRDLTLSVLAKGVAGASGWNATQTLDAALAPGGAVEWPLWIQGAPDAPLLAVMCRVVDSARKLDQQYAVGGASTTQYHLHATDPRVYAAATLASIGVPLPPGGASFPWTFPLTFGGGGAAGILTVTNWGNVETRPVLTITGPVTNPVVANTTTGWRLAFSNPNQSSYTLYDGDQLVVDTDYKSVIYYPAGSSQGTVRRNWIVAGSTWPNEGTVPLAGLAPGANVIELSSSDPTSVSGTLQVGWASAYLAAI